MIVYGNIVQRLNAKWIMYYYICGQIVQNHITKPSD